MLLLLGVFIYSILIILFAFYGGVAFEYYSPSFNTFEIKWDAVSAISSFLIPIILAGWAGYSEYQKDQLIKEEKQRQDEKDRMERMQNIFTRKIEPLITQVQQLDANITFNRRSTKKQEYIFLLIMQDLEKYRYIMIDIIAHMNKITPDMTEREQGIQGDITRRMHSLVEIISTIIFNLFDFEYLYFKDTAESNMIINTTITGNKVLLDLFESLVIRGIGKNNPDDYKQAMELVYNNHQKTIDNFTNFFKDTNLSQDRYEKNQKLQKFIKKHQ